MTKKDFELVAAALARVEAEAEKLTDEREKVIAVATVRVVIEELSTEIEKTHPRFKRGLFEIAAMPIENRRLRDKILAKLG